jgi:hypothetical protein
LPISLTSETISFSSDGQAAKVHLIWYLTSGLVDSGDLESLLSSKKGVALAAACGKA